MYVQLPCIFNNINISKCSIYSGYATSQWPDMLNRDSTVHKAMHCYIIFHVAGTIGADVLPTGMM